MSDSTSANWCSTYCTEVHTGQPFVMRFNDGMKVLILELFVFFIVPPVPTILN